MDTLATTRVHMLARLTFAWALLIVGRLVWLQVVQHGDYQKLAQQQQERVVELQAPRGTIVDRLGQRLALSLPVESVCVDPLKIPDRTIASEILSKVLDLDARELLQNLEWAVDNHRGFLWVKRRVTPEEAARLRELKLEWIEFRTETQRFYPNKKLAAHVIGGVDFAEKGNGGIEQSLNEELQGLDGELRLISDVQKRGFDAKVASEPQAGQQIRLTIDSRIQFVAERELKKAIDAHRSQSGSIIAMDPKTGDILALANYPT